MKGLLQALPKDLLCAELYQLPPVPASAPHEPIAASLCNRESPSTWQQDQGFNQRFNERFDQRFNERFNQRFNHNLSESQQALDRPIRQQNGRSSETQQAAESSHRQQGHALSDMHQADDLSSRQQTQTPETSHAQQAGGSPEKQQGQGRQSPNPQQDGATRRSGSIPREGIAWLLLSDGALPACCAAVQQSTDAHHKFHAVSALAYCLDRIKQCLQVWLCCEQSV